MPQFNFNGRVLHAAWTVALVVGASLFLVYTIDVLLVLFAGVLLAVPISWLTEKLSSVSPLPRYISLTTVVASIIALTVLLVVAFSPAVSQQIEVFKTNLPESLERIKAVIEDYPLPKFIAEWIDEPGKLINGNTVPVNQIMTNVSGFFSSTLGLMAMPLIILLMAIYLSAEPELYIGGCVQLFPEDQQDKIKSLIHQLGHTIRWWFFGQSLSMLILGVGTSVILSILNIPLALLLGLLTAIMTFVPNFGPLIAGVPTALIALSEGPWKALMVIVLYTALQQIEGSFITPMIHRKTLALPPALLIAAQIVLATLIGAIGVILAMPLLACGIVVIQVLYLKREFHT